MSTNPRALEGRNGIITGTNVNQPQEADTIWPSKSPACGSDFDEFTRARMDSFYEKFPLGGLRLPLRGRIASPDPLKLGLVQRSVFH